MACARCGAEDAGHPALNRHGEYDYCENCNDLFREAAENGVLIRSRHMNQEFDRLPFVIAVNVDGIDNPHSHTIHSPNKPMNQTEAFAMAKRIMDKHDLPGVFVYQKTGSVWLIDEYLEAHPGIAEDVEKERESREKGWISRLLGR